MIKSIHSQKAQALVEYILIFALIAIVLGAGIWAWREPLSHYFNSLAKEIAKPR
jgi:Flp pilus assembly pilin Flp